MRKATTEKVLSSENQNWMTPPDLVWAIELWQGAPFGWDAAASHAANKAAWAWSYFGPDQRDPALRDALAIDWVRVIPRGARVWMNPPYGRAIGRFIAKALAEAERGLDITVLAFDRTGTKWFRAMVDNPATRQVVFLPGRVVFYDPDTGEPRRDAKGRPTTATTASVLFRLGPGLRPPGTALEVLWQPPWGTRGIVEDPEDDPP